MWWKITQWEMMVKWIGSLVIFCLSGKQYFWYWQWLQGQHSKKACHEGGDQYQWWGTCNIAFWIYMLLKKGIIGWYNYVGNKQA